MVLALYCSYLGKEAPNQLKELTLFVFSHALNIECFIVPIYWAFIHAEYIGMPENPPTLEFYFHAVDEHLTPLLALLAEFYLSERLAFISNKVANCILIGYCAFYITINYLG